ncbi:MAG: hypothetical protein HOQ29_19095, partial [Acidobacteria bacterium]|nr:hypothetical protein [Acidobacteriota bacterium]
YPRANQLQVSNDAASWQTFAEGKGTGTATRIAFAPVRAKFVRITETSTTENAPPWTIQRLKLFEPAGKAAPAR